MVAAVTELPPPSLASAELPAAVAAGCRGCPHYPQKTMRPPMLVEEAAVYVFNVGVLNLQSLNLLCGGWWCYIARHEEQKRERSVYCHIPSQLWTRPCSSSLHAERYRRETASQEHMRRASLGRVRRGIVTVLQMQHASLGRTPPCSPARPPL